MVKVKAKTLQIIGVSGYWYFWRLVEQDIIFSVGERRKKYKA